MSTSNSGTSTQPELVITRIFGVPRKLVWKAWTDPKQMAQWMGPRGFTATDLSGEIRPGAPWRCCLRPDDGSEILWQGGIYREVIEPERMVFTFSWEGDNGFPENEMLITLTFEDLGDKTKMTLHQMLFRSVEQRDGHRGGWTSTFDRLEELLIKA